MDAVLTQGDTVIVAELIQRNISAVVDDADELTAVAVLITPARWSASAARPRP